MDEAKTPYLANFEIPPEFKKETRLLVINISKVSFFLRRQNNLDDLNYGLVTPKSLLELGLSRGSLLDLLIVKIGLNSSLL